jgi:hypothetical protein
MEQEQKDFKTEIPTKGNVINIAGGTVHLTIVETQNNDSGSVEALLSKIRNDRFAQLDNNSAMNILVTAAKEVGFEFAKAEQIKAKGKKK